MIISEVNQCGLKLLYNGLTQTHRGQKVGYGQNITQFLSHMSISLKLSDINDIELYALKKMTPDVKYMSSSTKNFLSAENNGNEYSAISGLISLTNEIEKDTDIKEGFNKYNILPVGCRTHNVIATFKGVNISSITGSIFQKFFVNKEGNFYTEYPEDNINNMIIENFYVNFYNYLAECLDSIDIVTDFMLHNNYYSYIDNERVILSHINSPLGSIEFLGNTSEGLLKQFVSLNKYIKAESKLKNPSINDIEVFFELSTTFSTFIEIMSYSNYVTDVQDIKMLLGETYVETQDDIQEKYSRRIVDFMNTLFAHREELLTDKTQKIQRYSLIFGGQKIKYTIKIPLKTLRNIENINIPSDTSELKVLKNDINTLMKYILSIIK